MRDGAPVAVLAGDPSGRDVPGLVQPAPVSLPSCCPGCGLVLDADRLAHDLWVCRCGWHFPQNVEAWCGLLADPGSWREHWTDLRSRDLLRWSNPKSYRTTLDDAEEAGLNEAVRVGSCTISHLPIWLAVFDFRFVGGTLGVVAGERLTRVTERATWERAPLLVVTASGGARMQEGAWALVQMAKVNGAVASLRDAGVPFLTVLTHPTYGGTAASVAFLADIVLAEPGAAIGFTGPRVIQQATQERLPAGFQTAEFQLRHGQVDMVVPRHELRETLAGLLRLLG
jgi:acetyl-CoA carboxylase carboxyl transferase beta subunit